MINRLKHFKFEIFISICVFLIFIFDYFYHILPFFTNLLLVWIFIACYLYKKIYTFCALPYTYSSFISFIINFLIFSSYVLVFYNLYIGLPSPIYVENLSIFSQYRYLLFTIISLVTGMILIGTRLNSQLSNFVNKILSLIPSLKEEVRILLYTYNDSWLGDFCVKLVDLLYNKIYFRYFFFTLHFLLFYIFAVIRLGIIINFAFFHGDLRSVLYLMPLSFFVWISNFFYYYFFWFIEANWNYMNDVFSVNFTQEVLTNRDTIVTVYNPEQIIFEINTYGISEGYSPSDIKVLKHKYILYANAISLLRKYIKKTYILNYSFFICYFLCWCNILYFSFYKSGLYLTGFFALTRRALIPNNSLLRFHPTGAKYARDARALKEHKMPDVAKKTDGAYGPGHYLYGEQTSPTKYRADGQLSQGAGHPRHPTQPLLPNAINSNSAKNAAPQNYNPFPQPIEIDVNDTHAPIPGSSQKLEDPAIKAKLDSHMPKFPSDKTD